MSRISFLISFIFVCSVSMCVCSVEIEMEEDFASSSSTQTLLDDVNRRISCCVVCIFVLVEELG